MTRDVILIDHAATMDASPLQIAGPKDAMWRLTWWLADHRSKNGTEGNMIVFDTTTLMSLRNEADRQAAFYERKLNDPLREFWAELGAMTDCIIRMRGSIVIEMRERTSLPIPIKACEQGQQTQNNNVIKAFQ